MALTYEVSLYKKITKIISLKGNFTKLNFNPIASDLETEITDEEVKFIILDLGEVTMLTSFALVQILMYKKKKSNKIALIKPRPRVNSFLTEAKFNNAVSVFSSFDAALAFFESKFGGVDESQKHIASKKYIIIKKFLRYHYLLNEVLFNLKNSDNQNDFVKEDYNTNRPSKRKNPDIIDEPEEKNKQEPTNVDKLHKHKPIIIVVTESNIHGKLLAKVFAENKFEVQVFTVKEFNFIFKRQERVMSWVFFEDAMEKLDNNEIYSTIEKIRNYELLHSLVISPIVILRSQLEYDEEALRTFKGFNVSLLNQRMTDNKNILFDEVFNLLKERDYLDLYLSKFVLFRLSKRDISLKFLSNVSDEDIEVSKRFLFTQDISDIIKKVLIFNIELKYIHKTTDKIYNMLIQLNDMYHKKIMLYIFKSKIINAARFNDIFANDRLNVV